MISTCVCKVTDKSIKNDIKSKKAKYPCRFVLNYHTFFLFVRAYVCEQICTYFCCVYMNTLRHIHTQEMFQILSYFLSHVPASHFPDTILSPHTILNLLSCFPLHLPRITVFIYLSLSPPLTKYIFICSFHPLYLYTSVPQKPISRCALSFICVLLQPPTVPCKAFRCNNYRSASRLSLIITPNR